MPAWMTGPLVIGAPESKLPVCAGWIPCPVECLLNSPLMTVTFFLIGSSGDKLRLSFMSSPDPVAPQWFSLTPLPMKSTAKRLGKGELGVAAKADMDSSHGRAMVTPAPRRTVRRDSFISLAFLHRRALFQELGAGDDGIDQRAELISVRRKLCVHPLDERLIRQQQGSPQSVYEHFTTKVVQKVFFAIFADV